MNANELHDCRGISLGGNALSGAIIEGDVISDNNYTLALTSRVAADGETLTIIDDRADQHLKRKNDEVVPCCIFCDSPMEWSNGTSLDILPPVETDEYLCPNCGAHYIHTHQGKSHGSEGTDSERWERKINDPTEAD